MANMIRSAALLSLSLLAGVRSQQVGTLTAENHPTLPIQQCSAGGSCTNLATTIVLDANWRWLHSTSGSTNCYTGNTFDTTLCPDPVTCAKNCAVDGADYSGTYGITTSGNALTIKFVTKGANTNIGSRVFLLSDASHYQLFNLNNAEFTFDVDVSQLPCGLNGALYFSQMDADGGLAKYPNNKAGAKYGTGYCDSQCPHDIKFINGEANTLGWTGSPDDPNAGSGQYGTCCNEMDIWEANSIATAYTPHVCSPGQSRCSGTSCGDGADRSNGVCDKDGCDFNSYRMGNTSFIGPGKTIDTTKKFTVVTQFVTNDNTATGTLSEIRRVYVQNGVVFANSQSNIAGVPGNSITDSFCAAQKTAFTDTNTFAAKGGLAGMGTAFKTGMVLVMSLWDDHAAQMLWLDSNYPTTASASTPGIARGSCATTSGQPTDVEKNSPNAQVIFSNIKYGPIGSTYNAPPPNGSTTSKPVSSTSKPVTSATTTSKPVTTTSVVTSAKPTTSSVSGTVPRYGQCGGIGWTGGVTCVSPWTCQVGNPYYSQCL